MKIKSVYIEAFGKLKDYRYVFTDGFNLIYGDNEYGKTTLMAFIKMMFYGTPNNAAGRAEREHYMPWSGERCAGYIDYELNGTDYRLVREFAQTNSGDKITLEKLNVGRPEKISPRDTLGEKIFGCSLECFERSLFIGSLNDSVTGKEALGEINNRLSNLVSTGEEDTSAKIVTDRLTKAKHIYMSRGGKIGIYDKNAARLADLKNDLIEIREKYSGKTRLEKKVSGLKTMLSDEEKRLDELSAIFSENEKFARAKKLRELISAANDLNRKSIYITCKNGELLSDTNIDALREKKIEIKSALSDTEKLEEELSAFEVVTDSNETSAERKQIILDIIRLDKEMSRTQEEIIQGDAALERAAQNGFKISAGALPVILGVLGGVLIAAAVALFFLTGLIPCLICGAVGGVSTLVSLVRHFTAKKRASSLRNGFLTAKEELLEKKAYYRTLQEKMDNLEARSKNIEELENGAAAENAARQQLFAQKQSELTARCERLSMLENQLKVITDNLPSSDIEALSNALRNYSSCATTLAYISEEVGCDAEGARKELEAMGDIPENIPDNENLRNDITIAQDKVNSLKGEILRINSEIKTQYSTLPVPAQLEREIAELEETLLAQKNYCDSIDIALEVLEQAGDELRSTWGGELNDKVKGIFSLLTGGRYTEAYVTKDLSMTAVTEESYTKRFVEHLSAGTRDQAYFSLRLAVCELLFKENGSVPIFLDDVFERYDDTRARRGIEFLKNYSFDRQIIFFTCHENFTKM